MTTAEHLAQYSVTLNQARDFIVSNLSAPNVIYETCLQFGVSASMIAEIYGGVTKEQVVSFFDSQGLNGSALEANDIISSPTVLSSEGAFSLSFILGSTATDVISAGTGPLPSIEVAIGMEGDDNLIGNSNTAAALLGGSGDDTYTAGSAGHYVVMDTSGSNDHLNIPYSFAVLEATLINDGRDLGLYTHNFELVLPDWQNPDNRIETISLSDANYNYNDLAAAVNIYAVNKENPYYFGMDLNAINKQIQLFEKLASVDSSNSAEILNFDTSQVVGSDSLIDYFI